MNQNANLESYSQRASSFTSAFLPSSGIEQCDWRRVSGGTRDAKERDNGS